jgi:hypothetical protein
MKFFKTLRTYRKRWRFINRYCIHHIHRLPYTTIDIVIYVAIVIYTAIDIVLLIVFVASPALDTCC